MDAGKQVGGAAKDSLLIAFSRVTDDPVSRAILKTTSHALEAPNEKHLKRLLTASKADSTMQVAEVLDQFHRRLHVHDTIVVLKTLTTMHCLLQDGGQPIVTEMCKQVGKIFNHRTQLKDIAETPEQKSEMRFIRTYMRYLEERCIAATASELRLEDDIFSNDQQWTPTVAATVTTCMRSWIPQLKAMTEIDLDASDLQHHCAQLAAMRAVLKDSRRLYTAFTIRMIWMLERVYNLPIAERKELMELFQQYCAQIRALNTMCGQVNRITALGDVAVQLQELPASAVQKLRDATSDKASCETDALVADEVPEGVEVALLDPTFHSRQPEQPSNASPTAPTGQASPTAPPPSAAPKKPVEDLDLFEL